MVLQERTETGKTSSARLCSRDLSLRAGFPHSTGPPIATSATVHCTGLCQGTWPSGYAGTPWTSSGWYRRFPSGMPKFSPGTYQPISTGYRPALPPPTRGGGGARSAGGVGATRVHCTKRSPGKTRCRESLHPTCCIHAAMSYASGLVHRFSLNLQNRGKGIFQGPAEFLISPLLHAPPYEQAVIEPFGPDDA